MVEPSARMSVLQAGSVHDTVRLTVLTVTHRSSVLENSISRSIHQDPKMRASLGLQGPPAAHAADAEGSSGMISRMSPSQCFAGPMPRLQLRMTSVRARCVAWLM